MNGRFLDAVITAGREARSVVLATELKSGRQLLIEGGRTEGELTLDETGLAAMREALRADRNRMIDGPDGRVFIQVFSPPRRCFVVGAVSEAR
jgi:xanthine dehydrogenase accessory factor